MEEVMKRMESRARALRDLALCRVFNPGGRAALLDLADSAEMPAETQMYLRELANCEAVSPDGREALRAAADLYHSRADMLRPRMAS